MEQEKEKKEFRTLSRTDIELIVAYTGARHAMYKRDDWVVRGVPARDCDGNAIPGTEADCDVYTSHNEKTNRQGVWFSYRGPKFEGYYASDLQLRYYDDGEGDCRIGLTASMDSSVNPMLFMMAMDLSGSLTEKVFTPYKWWTGWSSFMGNTLRHEEVFSTIAELLVAGLLAKRSQHQGEVKWLGPDNSSCDISVGGTFFEVKSTLSGHTRKIHINNRKQISSGVHLFLVSLDYQEKNVEGGLSLGSILKRIDEIDPVLANDASDMLKRRNLDGNLYWINVHIDSVQEYIVHDEWKEYFLDPQKLPQCVDVQTYLLDMDKTPFKCDRDWTEDMIEFYGLPKRG